MKKISLIMLCAIIGILGGMHGAAAAAADRDTPAASVLTAKQWQLRELHGEAVPAAAALTLDIDESGRFSGSDGCNTVQGRVKLNAEVIAFDKNFIGTLRSCDAGVERRAQAFRAALLTANHYRVSGDQLALYGASLKLKPLAIFALATSALTGTRWQVISYNNGKGGVVSLINGSAISAEFGSDGRLTGHAGCNNYFADYLVDGSTITLATPGSTRRACERADWMAQETAYLRALASATQFRMNADRLEMRNANGSLVVIFHKQKQE